MRKIAENKKSISGLAALLVFGIFAICVLAVLLMGARTYQGLNERDQAAYQQRTCAHYISTKVRQSGGKVSLDQAGDGDALVFEEEIEGETYLTYVYCYDGWIRECFISEGSEPDLDFGEKVVTAEYLSLAMEDNLLWVLIEDTEGVETELQLQLRSGGEVQYEE